MSRLTFLIILLALLTGSCSKKSDREGLAGKVIRISCASYVIQVYSNKDLGEDNWKDLKTQVVHDNVFNALGKCEIPDDIKEGDHIRFGISDDTPPPCATCFLYDAPPSVTYFVKDVTLAK
ncbi:MAG: hypothetical protein QM731_09995 [Chitinophagaceae bacterium]